MIRKTTYLHIHYATLFRSCEPIDFRWKLAQAYGSIDNTLD